MSFMLGGPVRLFDQLRYFLGNIFPFEIVVYHFVANFEFIFIKLTRMLVKQVDGRQFGINPLIRTKKTQ